MRNRRKSKNIVITPGSNTEIEKEADRLFELIPDDGYIACLSPTEQVSDVRTYHVRTTPITIAVPMDELMYSKFFANFYRIGVMPWDSIFSTESTYLPDARNYLHEKYIELCEASPYLLMLDSDVLPPPDIIMRLIAHNLPIVGGWYKTKKGHNAPCVYDYDRLDENGIECFKQRKEAGVGLEVVDGIGAGCLLIKRDLALALGKRPYDMNSGGEDLKLCRSIQKLGYKIYVDWSVACAHVGIWYV